jgi:hypothetical protein
VQVQVQVPLLRVPVRVLRPQVPRPRVPRHLMTKKKMTMNPNRSLPRPAQELPLPVPWRVGRRRCWA